MTKTYSLIIGIIICLSAYSQKNPLYQKLPPTAYQEDITILSTALKESLMELYMYQDSITFENKINSILKRTDTITLKDFYTEIKKLLAPLGSEHLKVFFAPKVYENILKNKFLLPIEVRFINNKVVCYYNYSGGELNNGCEIVAINGINMVNSVRTLLDLTNAGGLIQAAKCWIFEDLSFSEKYHLFIDTAQTFKIDYIKPNQTITNTIVLKGQQKGELIKQFTTKEYLALHNEKSFTKPYHLKIENGIAVINIEQFYENITEKTFNEFYEKSFKEISAQNINYLIIDVRRNLGGWQKHGYHLMQYFTPQKFSPIESVWFKNDWYHFLEYTDTKDRKLKLSQVEKSGRYYRQRSYDWLTQSVFKPKENYFFKGKVIVLTNEGTSSAACFFTNAINTFNDSVLFVGKESESVSTGSSSGFMPTLTLPNSKLKVKLAFAYFKSASKPNTMFGRGLIPDYIIESDLSGKDKEMEFAIEYIDKLRKK